MRLSTWKVIRGLLPYTPGEWEVTNIQRTESYWFQTQEWAQFCADHFNRLEDIKNSGQIINIQPTNYDSIVSRNYTLFESPKSSEWSCLLFGSKGEGITWTPAEDKVPNWFWRKMQYLFFGNMWVKK